MSRRNNYAELFELLATLNAALQEKIPPQDDLPKRGIYERNLMVQRKLDEKLLAEAV